MANARAYLPAPTVAAGGSQVGECPRITIVANGLRSTACGAIVLISAAGWSSSVARRAHNPKVAGSNPAPATKEVPAQKGFPIYRKPLLRVAMYQICTTSAIRRRRDCAAWKVLPGSHRPIPVDRHGRSDSSACRFIQRAARCSRSGRASGCHGPVHPTVGGGTADPVP